MPKKIQKLNKVKKLTKSSQKWILRQINDPILKKSQQMGYRSRAAFKIIEIDDKFKIFKKGKIVVDLGAAPGGWSQIAAQKCGENNVFALDLLEMDEIPGVNFLQLDFLEEDSAQKICEIIKEKTKYAKADVVLTDMAANTTGDKKLDHLRIINLLEESLNFAVKILNKDGSFVGKIFQGGSSDEIVKILKRYFKIVKYFKPDSSRKDSKEIYLVAHKFDKKTF